MVMTDQSAQPVVIEVNIAAPIDTVWASLRDPALIKLWHGWEYDGLDAEIDQIYIAGADADDEAQVLQVDGGDRFELEDQGDEIVVRITRPVLGPEGEGVDYFDDITQGWISFLQQLKFMHELHPDRPRRTLFFSDRGDPDALLALVSSTPRLLGQRWFSTEHQDGIMLPDLGPGLLITATKEVTAGEHAGAAVDAMAIISTYGMDEETFRRHEAEWTEWWRSGFQAVPDAEV